MKDCTRRGELLFRWVCLVLVYSVSVESLNWTAQPAYPIELTEGKDVSLTWNYNLTADELTKSATFFKVSWRKFSLSSSVYDQLANYLKITGVVPTFSEQSPHIVIDRATGTNSSTLHFNDVRMDDEGMYKIDISVEFPGTVIAAFQEFNLTVVVPPKIVNVSSDQEGNTGSCEGSTVTLSCNATGKPTPNITWTRAFDNGTDSALLLPVVDGKYVMNNIMRSSNGTYRCTADNGVGGPVNRTVRVTVKYSASVVRIVNSSNSVNEGRSFNMTCEASGDLKPNVHWIKVDNGKRIDGNILNFTNINRSDAGQYRCEAKNDCGSDSRVQSIDVYYKPDTVELVTNATNNTDCSDLWVNFTCVASKANPAVYNFLLDKKDGGISSSKSGTWIKVLGGGKHVYSCLAQHLLGNITSTNNVILTVKVPPSVEQLSDKTFEEDSSVSLYCEESGHPDPTVTWSKVGGEAVIEGNWLNITNITRAEAGQYRCRANNTCGNVSSIANIDVQFPSNIANVSSGQVVCEGSMVTLSCNVTGNPTPNITWTRVFDNGTDSAPLLPVVNGKYVMNNVMRDSNGTYRCTADNGVGDPVYRSVRVIVRYSASIVKIVNSSNTINEGGPFNMTCEVTGDPKPNVHWIEVDNGQRIDGNILNFTNINRNVTGQYRCVAENNCGNDSRIQSIEVYYKPGDVSLNPNISNSIVCAEFIVNFTCTANANPPVDNYTLYENGTVVNTRTSGVWMISINTAGRVVYSCEANNSQGSEKSGDTTFNVEVPASVTSVDSKVVNESNDVTLFCNVSGVPSPNVSWINDKNNEVHVGAMWALTNITRKYKGEYKCIASNTCGSDNKTAVINVQYPPNITHISENRTVNQSETVNPICTADGNPLRSITWTRVSDNSVVKFPLTITGKKDEGFYRCTAENGVGKPDTAEFFIAVQNYGPFGARLSTNLSDNTVVLHKSFNLNCSAQANPTAKYRFYKEQESLLITPTSSYFAVTTTSVSDRKNEVKFSCTPFNEYGDGSSTMIIVTVHYAPSVDPKVTEIEITKGGTARYICPVVGNPPPNITWYEGNGINGNVYSSGKELAVKSLQSDRSYTCLARNNLGTDTGSVHFKVGEKSITNETVSVIKITLTISNKNCKTFSEKEFVEKIKKLYESDGIEEVIVVDKRCDSTVTLDLELHFTKDVSEKEVITTLKDAAKNDRLGDFKVDPDSIKRTKKKEDVIPWILIGAVVGGVVVMVVIIAVVAWCVHKKRNCRRKGTKVCNSESDVAPEGQVNGGYADSGPPSANGPNRTDTSVLLHEQPTAAAPPTYAVVDKKKKKEKKADKKEDDNVAKQDVPDYAVVDKSKKKKKKEEVEDAYAQVDMSKKSKKKPKPGEMLYADLGDFQPRAMPAVSTSPAPLPPIKRPPAYEETQYADITQFLTGNATLPDANNSQGTEMTSANTGGNEKPKETANEGGNDEKPKETRM